MVGTGWRRKPRWLLRPLPSGPSVTKIQGLLQEHGLHAVCEEARCPNRGECWSLGEATLMMMATPAPGGRNARGAAPG